MQQLQEKFGVREAPWLRAVAKSQHLWLEDPSLYFLEFPWCSSRYSFRNERNGNSLCKVSQIDYNC